MARGDVRERKSSGEPRALAGHVHQGETRSRAIVGDLDVVRVCRARPLQLDGETLDRVSRAHRHGEAEATAASSPRNGTSIDGVDHGAWGSSAKLAIAECASIAAVHERISARRRLGICNVEFVSHLRDQRSVGSSRRDREETSRTGNLKNIVALLTGFALNHMFDHTSQHFAFGRCGV
jgi:hypothetical protein